MAPSDNTSELSESSAPFVIPFTIAARSTTCSEPAEHTQNSPIATPAVRSESPTNPHPDNSSSLDESHSAFTEQSDVAIEEGAEEEASSRDFTPDVSMPRPRVLKPTISQTSRASSKKPRTKTSHIHEHISTRGDSFICNSCSRSYKISGGTGAIARHLKKYHSITPTASGISGKRTQERRVIDNAVLRRATTDHNIQGKRREEVMGDGLDKNTLEYLYRQWANSQDLPPDHVNDEGFRSFLEYINPAANRMLPNFLPR